MIDDHPLRHTCLSQHITAPYMLRVPVKTALRCHVSCYLLLCLKPITTHLFNVAGVGIPATTKAEYVTLFFVMSIVEDELIRLHQSSIMKGLNHFLMILLCYYANSTKVQLSLTCLRYRLLYSINKPITIQN